MEVSLISVSRLRKDYHSTGGHLTAIEDVSFDLDEGDFLAVVGPSGCGKTTLLRILAGLTPPTAGDALLQGKKITGPSEGIGVVFQEPVLLPWRTVFDNVLLPIEVLGLDIRDGKRRVGELLELVDLTEFSERHIWELSGGMQQRVAIARALVNDPVLLLMDEPFGALDAMTREQMNLKLQQICAQTGKTTVFITHNLVEAVFLANRVLVLTPRPATARAYVHVDLRGFAAAYAGRYSYSRFRVIRADARWIYQRWKTALRRRNFLRRKFPTSSSRTVVGIFSVRCSCSWA